MMYTCKIEDRKVKKLRNKVIYFVKVSLDNHSCLQMVRKILMTKFIFWKKRGPNSEEKKSTKLQSYPSISQPILARTLAHLLALW